MANGLLSDWMSGTGVYGNPNAIDPQTGVPYADTRAAQLGALGNIGSLLIAAGQPMTGAQRAQLLGQIGPQISGMQTDIYNAAQRRLMQAQFADQMAARSARTALAEEAKADPVAFEKKYGFNPVGLPAESISSLVTKVAETNAVMGPERSAIAAAQNVFKNTPTVSPSAALAAGKGPTVEAAGMVGQHTSMSKYDQYMAAGEAAMAQGTDAGMRVANSYFAMAEKFKPQKGEIFGSAEGGYYRAIPGQEPVQIVAGNKKEVKPQIFGGKETGYYTLDDAGNVRSILQPQTKGFSPETASAAHTIRTEFLGQEPVKTFATTQKNAFALKDIVDRAKSGEAGVATGANDIAIVYNFFKTIDPTSVVRESEFGSVAQNMGLPASVVSAFQKVSGGGFLPNETRDELVKIANTYLDKQYQDVKNLSDTYKAIAEQAGIDPKLVDIDLRSPQFKTRQAQEEEARSGIAAAKEKQNASDPVIAQINKMTISDALAISDTQRQSWNDAQKRAFLDRIKTLNAGVQ
jgi:hypothetical protein